MHEQLEVGRVYTFSYRGGHSYGDDVRLPASPQPSHVNAPYMVRDHPQDDSAHYIRVVKGSDAPAAPVLLWVHGGSILTGSAGFPIYDPVTVAEELGCTFVSVNYRLGLASRPRRGDGGIDLEKMCFAVADVVTAFEYGMDYLSGAGESVRSVFIGGHSVGATIACGLSERYSDLVVGIIAATPILEPFRGAERSEVVATHDASLQAALLSISERLLLQGEMDRNWSAGEHGDEVLGLWRPQFGTAAYPWENEDWELALPVFATWSEGEYGEYGRALQERVARCATKPGDKLWSIGIDQRFGLNAKEIHLAAIPLFFGNEDHWGDSILSGYLDSSDFDAEHSALLTELRRWMSEHSLRP